MFSQPELVIDSYILGIRKRYVNVLTYLSISLTLVAIQVFIFRKIYPELLVTENSMTTGIPDLDNLNNAIFDYQGVLTILVTPFAGLMSRITFWKNKKYNWAEHMVINIYPSAQFYIVWFFCTFIIIGFKIPFQQVSLVSLLLLTIYMVYIFKRIYHISYPKAMFKTIIYFILYSAMMTIFFFIFAIVKIIYLISSGQLDPSKFS